jgi:hypothetical protein
MFAGLSLCQLSAPPTEVETQTPSLPLIWLAALALTALLATFSGRLLLLTWLLLAAAGHLDAAGIALPSGRLLAHPELNFLRGRLCAEPLNER